MSDYNFKPDYKKYWNKKITAEQAAALALGIDPAILAKVTSLYERGEFLKRGTPNPAVPGELGMTVEEAVVFPPKTEPF